MVRLTGQFERWIALVVLLVGSAATQAVQIQDLVRIKGAETNKLVGMGLVVGLRGTGDGGKFAPAMRPLAAMMQRLIDPNTIAAELKDVNNVALVSLTAKLPESGVREGDHVDVQVASLGPASSLAGGRLFMTPLMPPVPGQDIQPLAFAEGPIIIEDDATPTTGVIQQGAVMTRDILSRYVDDHGRMTLIIHQANATWPMANTLATLINDLMAPDGPPLAFALDQKNIIVQMSRRDQLNPASFVSQILEIQLDPSLVRTGARVVINERTGTIVMTADVQLSPVIISHNGLTITTINPQIPATAENPEFVESRFVGLDPGKRAGARLGDLLDAFNQLKVSADDRIAIIKELHRTGKLHAQLILED
jgi:flagellar P-ring protein precursor FlgI